MAVFVINVLEDTNVDQCYFFYINLVKFRIFLAMAIREARLTSLWRPGVRLKGYQSCMIF